MGLMGLLSNLRKIPVDSMEVKKVVTFLRKHSKKLSVDIPTAHNQAKQLALKLKEKVPILIVADFLDGAAYAVRNLFHETAKHFGLYFAIPEANHHLMEGLAFPKEIKKLLLFVFFVSPFYDKRNIKRIKVTQEVVEKNDINTTSVSLLVPSYLGQTMEFIQLGAWLTFYLAILNKVDPTQVPWVDYFKKKLKGG